jgi:hypothetical protein
MWCNVSEGTNLQLCRLRLKCDGTREETRFRLSAKRTSPFKSACGWGGAGGGSVQSTTGRRAVHISLQSMYCSYKPVFCSHVTLTGYKLHSLFPLHFSARASPCAITFQTQSTYLFIYSPSDTVVASRRVKSERN